MPNIKQKKLNINQDENINPINMINKTASFSGTKEFRKINEDLVLPRMICDEDLVIAFRNEAQARQWKLTTLMNNILRERYNKKRDSE